MKGDDIADRLVDLAVSVIRIVDGLPETAAGKHIGAQLLRCGTSPGANYEEARGAESRRDFVHKLGIALKELQETYYWLRVIARGHRIDTDAPRLISEVAPLCRIIGKSRVTAQAGALARGAQSQ